MRRPSWESRPTGQSVSAAGPIPGDFALFKPLARLTKYAVTPTPGPSGINRDGQAWNSTDRLEFLFTFGKPVALKTIGGVSLPAQAAAFAGPGGKDKDRVCVVGPDGSVSVLVLK
jgi:hypothetical protein